MHGKQIMQKNHTAQRISDMLIRIVKSSAEKLAGLDSKMVRKRPGPLKWSIQEILGHLIDSAANNHQRFVRAQQMEMLVFPGYEQDVWVDLQRYNTGSWTKMVELWKLLNLHLAKVIADIPEIQLSMKCKIGQSDAVTLGDLVEDYVSHLEHHLQQIEEKAQNGK